MTSILLLTVRGYVKSTILEIEIVLYRMDKILDIPNNPKPINKLPRGYNGIS